MLDKIKIMLDITSTNKDALLKEYIEQCIYEIEAYTRRPATDQLDNLIALMVVEKYNKRFNEGISSSSASGVSTSFKDGYSNIVMYQLNALRKKVQIL